MQVIVLLRWVLIIATSYLVLFSSAARQTSPTEALFVVGYFASNIALPPLWRRVSSRHAMRSAVVLFDTMAASLGLVLTNNVSSDFFLLFFLVLFLGALTNRLGLVAGAAVLSCVIHLVTVSQYIDLAEMARQGYLLRVPFLLVVALFFGHLVGEESRSRERRRLDFVTGVSHDLKNPLGVIHSMSEFLLDGSAGPLTADQQQLVQRIHDSARGIISLSRNLLDVARIGEGRLLLQFAPSNLADVVSRAVALAQPTAEARCVTLRCSLAAGLPAISLDPAQMERVVGNLVDNAVKYTSTGGVVDISLRAELEEVVLAVHDDGPGIPAHQLEAIFDKYRRFTSTRAIQGTGLGLFIVRSIAEAHGGRVAGESAVGQGTTIRVRLPLRRESPPPSRWLAAWRWLPRLGLPRVAS